MRTSIRTLVVACAAAGAAAFPFAAPASADITVMPTQLTQTDSTSLTPAQPVQGQPARLAFTVTTTSRTASTTKVQVLLPEDTPIAEVFPLSAPDWAPLLTEKRLAKPIQGVHGGQIDQIVRAITWTTVPGRAIKPGQSSVLQVEAGPMPATEQIVLDLVQTYSDGTVTRSKATVKLSPPTAGQAQGHNAHGDAAADPAAAPESSGDGSDSGGTNLALIIAILLVGLVAGAVVALAIPRLRRGAAGLKVSPEVLNAPPPAER
jgi:hypothetical protein